MKLIASILLTFLIYVSSAFAQDPNSFDSLSVTDQSVLIGGQKMDINPDGFLKQVSIASLSDSVQRNSKLLYEPVHFHYYIDAKKQLKFVPVEFRFLTVGKDSVSWFARSNAEGLKQDVFGKVYANGVVRFRVYVSGDQIKFDNVNFHIPFEIAKSKYFGGLGQKDNLRPDTVRWNSGNYVKIKPAFWVGYERQGLYLRLDNQPAIHQNNVVNGWLNQKNKGLQINVKGSSMLSDFITGPIELASGQELSFNYTMIVSPTGNLKMPVNSQKKFKRLLQLDLQTK